MDGNRLEDLAFRSWTRGSEHILKEGVKERFGSCSDSKRWVIRGEVISRGWSEASHYNKVAPKVISLRARDC